MVAELDKFIMVHKAVMEEPAPPEPADEGRPHPPEPIAEAPQTTPQKQRKQRKPGAGRRQSVWNGTYNRWIEWHISLQPEPAFVQFKLHFRYTVIKLSQFKRQYYKIKSRLYRSTLPAPVEEQPPQPEVPDVIEDIAIQPHPPFKIDDKVRLKQPHNHTGIGIVKVIKDNQMWVEFDAGTIWVHKDAVIKVE